MSSPFPRLRRIALGAALCLAAAGGCGGDDSSTAANLAVRERIDSLAPAANLGHRGTGPTRPGHALPENSLASFAAAMRQGADGIELDVELTADGQLIVMHDDRLDRTTDCSGCVSAHSLAAVRACRLLDGAGEPTAEHPPTLGEVYDLLPPDALVNIELKVYGAACRTAASDAAALALAAVAAVEDLGVARRTLFSSFALDAVLTVKAARPDYYAALLLLASTSESVAPALGGALDALHPFYAISAELTQVVRAAGLQVNMWTINDAPGMNAALDEGATAIITDEPGALAAVLAQRGAQEAR